MAVVVGRAGPESYSVLDSPWSVDLSLTPGDPAGNLESINDCIVAAEAAERSVVIPGLIGINGSVIGRPTVTIRGSVRPYRASTLATSRGAGFFLYGTVPVKTPILKMGDKAQTETFDNASAENLLLWGSDIQTTLSDATTSRSSIGIAIRSNGLLASPTYRTKGLRFTNVVVSNCAFSVEIGPPPQAAPNLSTFATSTDYIANMFVKPITPNGRVYRCITAGTSGGSSPTWTTITGKTITSGSAVFMDWGAEETGRNEEQSDGNTFDRVDLIGGTTPYCGVTAYGANAGDATVWRDSQFGAACASGNANVDLLSGGYWRFENSYAGYDASSRDFFRIWQPGPTLIEMCQCESMRYFMFKPSQSSQYEGDSIFIKGCPMDTPIRLEKYVRVISEGTYFKPTSSLYLDGAQWQGRGDLWHPSGRAMPLTVTGAGSYSNERTPYAGNPQWIMQGERIFDRVPTSGTALYDVCTVSGLKATARANTTAYVVGDVRMNAAGTYAFTCTVAGTTAGAEPGGMGAPSLTTTYTDGTVTWRCDVVTPTTKTGMTLS